MVLVGAEETTQTQRVLARVAVDHQRPVLVLSNGSVSVSVMGQCQCHGSVSLSVSVSVSWVSVMGQCHGSVSVSVSVL